MRWRWSRSSGSFGHSGVVLAFALVLAIGAALLATSAPANAALEPAPEGVSVQEVVRAAERAMRGDRSYIEARMIVRSPRLSTPRVVVFHSWNDGPGKRSFIRILEPAKDSGSGFLKLHPNLWMYVPRVDRTIRVPPSMMLQSWMGSDFSNDDLVRESSEIDDYEHVLKGVDPGSAKTGGRRAYVIEYQPHEDAPVVWGRILAWIDAELSTPLFQEFYDEEGEKIREMQFEDVREVDGRYLPHRWTLTPLDKPGHQTVMEVQKMVYDLEIEASVFTTRNLKRGRTR